MIQPSQLIAIFQRMLAEKWKYQWGAAREGVVDCSGAFAYAFRKLGGSIYHGSNTMWRKYTTEKGKMGQIEMIPGMAVFRWKKSGDEPAAYKGDGQGNFYHVGLYIGNAEVIEAKSSKSGVVKSAASSWPYAARLAGVDYTGESQETPASGVLPTLCRGSTGYWVKEAQLRLIAHGFLLNVYGADGIFGEETFSAVRSFQVSRGLDADGTVGPDTWEELNAEPDTEEALYQVLIPSLTLDAAKEFLTLYPGATLLHPGSTADG